MGVVNTHLGSVLHDEKINSFVQLYFSEHVKWFIQFNSSSDITYLVPFFSISSVSSNSKYQFRPGNKYCQHTSTKTMLSLPKLVAFSTQVGLFSPAALALKALSPKSTDHSTKADGGVAEQVDERVQQADEALDAFLEEFPDHDRVTAHVAAMKRNLQKCCDKFHQNSSEVLEDDTTADARELNEMNFANFCQELGEHMTNANHFIRRYRRRHPGPHFLIF